MGRRALCAQTREMRGARGSLSLSTAGRVKHRVLGCSRRARDACKTTKKRRHDTLG